MDIIQKTKQNKAKTKSGLRLHQRHISKANKTMNKLKENIIKEVGQESFTRIHHSFNHSYPPSCDKTQPMSTSRLIGNTVSTRVLNADYAVRGRIVSKAVKLQQKDPSRKFIFCNIGNPQSFDQKPLTFPRRVLALTAAPELVHSNVFSNFPDVAKRAEKYLNAIPGGTGAYSQSQGIDIVRDEVASFISQRDSYNSSKCEYLPTKNDIYLTDGASPAVQRMLQLLIRDEKDGIMIPIPQYPLYSASIAMAGGTAIPYSLEENANWSMDMKMLEKSLNDARNKGICVRSMVVINPGNPTGQSLSRSNQETIAAFCHRNNLVLLADEVYQENIWNDKNPFISFRKIAMDMGMLSPVGDSPNAAHDHTGLQLASFHSVSKGFFGECGRRGGYAELTGFSKDVKAQYYKVASVNLCSNLDGQVMVGLMVNPPKKGDASYEQFEGEKKLILSTLAKKAGMVHDILSKTPNMACNRVDGALYAFPRIFLPRKAIQEAEKLGMPADEMYCLELLEASGIVVVPGSGFGQEDGSFHFRTTILPHEKDLETVLKSISTFHDKFWRKYNKN